MLLRSGWIALQTATLASNTSTWLVQKVLARFGNIFDRIPAVWIKFLSVHTAVYMALG